MLMATGITMGIKKAIMVMKGSMIYETIEEAYICVGDAGRRGCGVSLRWTEYTACLNHRGYRRCTGTGT